MSRSVSTSFKRAIYQQETTEVAVVLLTIDHDDLTSSLRISSDNKTTWTSSSVEYRGTLSRSNYYYYYPMRITLPDESEDSISEASIDIDNVERGMISVLRTLDSAPTIKMEVVLASAPDTVEASWPNFILKSVEADAIIVRCRLGLGNFLGEPFPGGFMGPNNFPGLF